MMAQRKHLMNSKKKLLSATISIALILGAVGCTHTKEIQLNQSEQERTEIARAEPPKPLDLYDVQWYVVTAETMDEVHEKIRNRLGGGLVYYAIIPKGYENLAVNLEEIRAYLKKQKANIRYYENYLYDNEKDNGNDKSDSNSE